MHNGAQLPDSASSLSLELRKAVQWEQGRVLHFGETKKAMAPHSSTLAWQIPWTEEPGGLQSMRSLRVGHD